MTQMEMNLLFGQRKMHKKLKIKIMLFISLAFFVSILTGCTTKSFYEGGQIGAKQKCNSQPPSEIEQCLKNLNNKTYKEYQNR